MKPIVIIYDNVHPILPQTFINKGFEVVQDKSINYERLLNLIPTATGLIVTSKIYIDKELINKGIQLKWIARLGSGLDIIDIEHAQSKNIKIISSPAGNANSVAEHCVGLLINLTKHITKSFNEIKSNQWIRVENRGIELSQKKLGIIGYGHTGQAFAKKLSGFDMEIYAYDKYKTNFSSLYAKETNLEFIQNNCEIISLHLPLTIETKHFANFAFFKKCKQKPIFISSCRGSVTSLSDLNEALDKNLVRAAGLDVLENELLETYTPFEKETLQIFCNKNNTIITPHIAGNTEESFYKISELILNNLKLL